MKPTVRRKPRDTTRDYVDNAKLLADIIEYKKKCKEAEEAGKEIPIVPNSIGSAIYLIAKNLSMKGNFVNYPFREDLASDGMETCIKYIRSFNEEKYSNPHAYYTQVCWYAFINRIKIEKKELYVKFKSSSQLIGDGKTFDGEDISGMLQASPEYMSSFIEDFEATIKKGKKEKKG